MAKRKVYLAVDLGAGSGRVMAGLYDGRTLALEEVNRFGNEPVRLGDHLHWNVLGLFARVKQGLRKAGTAYGNDLVSLGVDTWGVDYGLIDARGQLLGFPCAYRDPRTEGMIEEAARRIPKEELYATTGLQTMFFNTLYQLLAEQAAGTTALAHADRLLFMPDLLHYWLSGTKVVERTIASTSQLLDARSADWARGLIQQLGLPVGLFGSLVDPGEDLGRLLPSVTEETGLGKMRVIAPGSHDTASAVAAVPAQGDNHAYLSSGTWSLMGVEEQEPVLSKQSCDLGFTNERGLEDSIRLLKNICGLWLAQESRRSWAEQDGVAPDYADLNELAAQAEPFRALIDPDHERFATPGDMPARIAAFCTSTGQQVPESRGSVMRTIFESLALRYRTVFRNLEELTGRSLDVLHIVGGGSQNQVLSQMAADVLQKPVVTGPVEATALGNTLAQLQADGEIDSLDEGRALIRASFDTLTYEPGDAAPWDEAYDRFSGICEKS